MLNPELETLNSKSYLDAGVWALLSGALVILSVKASFIDPGEREGKWGKEGGRERGREGGRERHTRTDPPMRHAHTTYMHVHARINTQHPSQGRVPSQDKCPKG
jgi:hypothetical protein